MEATTTRRPFSMDAGIDHEPAITWIARNAQRCVEHAGELAACDDYQVRFAAESLREAAAAADAEWDRRKVRYLEWGLRNWAVGDRRLTIHTGAEVTCTRLFWDPDWSIFTSDGVDVNVDRLCDCRREQNDVFWCRPSGSHGWACGRCRKITQTG